MHRLFSMRLRTHSLRALHVIFCLLAILLGLTSHAYAGERVALHWSKQAAPVEAVSRYAPLVGVHNELLIIAGGISTNNSRNSTPKYLSSIWLGEQNPNQPRALNWKKAAIKLPSPRAYGASASFENGIVLLGGSDETHTFNDTLLVRRNQASDIEMHTLPALPIPMREGSAAFVGSTLYVLITATDTGKTTALYALDLSTTALAAFTQGSEPKHYTAAANWHKLTPRPQSITLVSQNDGRGGVLFALEMPNSDSQSSLWKYKADDSQPHWTPQSGFNSELPNLQLSSGNALAIGQSHFLLFASSANQTQVLSYNAITNVWAKYDSIDPQLLAMPVQQTTTSMAVLPWDGKILVHQANKFNSSLQVAAIAEASDAFGWQNMTVLVVYLFAMVLIGVYFVFKNKNVNDYFRGGQNIPWWANACSMYATMLSSLTFVGIPAIVYRTDWLYWGGIWMILAVTPIAAYVAMPFFRKIDATSAYEFLSLRFNMPVRLFASGLFTLFHISRMGIVMALTALALAAVTPFDAWQCVLIIGVLSLIYCTLGGIEAVIWTDTIQTVVLLLGALLCFAYIVSGVDGGIAEIFRSGIANDKFKTLDIDFSMDSFTKLSIWVIVLGGIGQNLSTYTADQSIVQRYMTTKDVASARKSIWTNGIMAPVASVLFFIIGTGLYVFYQSNPEKLDPTKQIDQIFPAFISSELPIGIAGLIIAGIFAAAQSTVSTSMNSMSTTLVTDFMRPFNLCRSEKGYLNAARLLTLLVGIFGTLVGLLFISPEIRSLMEEYFKVVGMFMGALGGLFILGIISTRANASGAMVGLFFGVITMMFAWIFELVEGYLFGTIGIVSCIFVGYVASALFSKQPANNLSGLTIHTMK
ncbi:sodium/solute symporter [Pseudoalteromonas sp. SG44-5]|uniref:sodium:solute symporter family transporter n=1 Tax=Pseudoalteromonas sp. SG44-5 TaxID=2760960 RepID=UPI0015FC1DA7|nr:sodium/solute symporter [Pseudoalteromonas sp. SG44-5]MBB1405268.1 sodium/solute symporter [Pseudoalteromonas sp. SG44-5]